MLSSRPIRRYNDLVWKLWEESEADGENKFPENYDEVKLTAEEEAFVERIDARMAEMRQQQFTQRDSYYLGNANNIVNLFQFKDIDEALLAKLQQNNFAITEGSNLQLFHAYEENDYRQVPNFITTDLYLQAFHMYFSYVLKSLENNTHSYFGKTMSITQRNLHKHLRPDRRRISERYSRICRYFLCYPLLFADKGNAQSPC